MNINTIYHKTIWVLLAVLAVTFTACSDDDDNKHGATLEAFGPTPTPRGGQVTFIGRNLDRISTVVFPEGVEVTTIEVIDSEHIKVTVPQNAEVGYVRLLGSGIEITSKTMITYTEPISIEKLSPNPVKPGDKLTIEGDYLNLITKVIFAGEVEVNSEDFITWERAKIELIVPVEAQTGVITLADDAVMPIELKSEVELAIVLPSVEEVLDLSDKKPGDEIKIAVKDIDLVEAIALANGDEVEFIVDDDMVVFNLPEKAIDGDISAVAYSGVRVVIANLGMRVPTELVATPATAIKAGDVITITGKDMDLVATVTFPNVEEEIELNAQSATEIKVTMPEMAQSGELILNTASGNTATVEIVTLKPQIVMYDPAKTPAGAEINIVGANLDLVAKVTFGGEVTVEVEPTGAVFFMVKVPETAQTGNVVLTMKNGETVEGPSLTVEVPQYCYIPELPGDDVDIIAGSIFTFEVENADKLEEVKVNDVKAQYILQGNKLNVPIPSNFGEMPLELISSNGSTTYTLKVVPPGEQTIFEGPLTLTWSDGGRVFLSEDDLGGMKIGSVVKFYFTIEGDEGQIQVNDGGWSEITILKFASESAATSDELEITEAILNQLNEAADGNAMILQGANLTIDKITLFR